MAYLTAAEIREAMPTPLENSRTYPDDLLERAVSSFEEIAEDYRGVAYEPRTATETFMVDCTRATLRLSRVLVRSITSVTVTAPAVGGTPTAMSSSLYAVDPDSGVLHCPTGFYANSKVVVVYSHGYDEPPQTVLDACLDYVRSRALVSTTSVPRDAIATSVEGVTTRFSTPDKAAGRPTGYIDVDRLLNSLPDFRVPF